MKALGFALFTLVVAGLARGLPCAAAVGPTFSFQVARAPHPLPLDPSLADPAWAAGRVPSAGAWQNVTTRAPADLATTVYLLYDDKNLYVGFKAAQIGVPVVATQPTDDVGFGTDDFVGIGVDTSGAATQTYYFEVTPRGTRYQQANENVRYRPHWQSAARIDRAGAGWSAVLIIPLKVLRVPRSGKQNWGLQFVRSVAARGEHLVWDWDPLMQDAPAGNWPSFQDSRWWAGGTIDLAAKAGARDGARADVYALGSVGGDRSLFEQANGAFLPERVRSLGLDVSYPLTPTISFVGTLAPDFSNVEVDQQTIAPQEFRRQLTEYRPFFAQGANFINASSGARSPTGPYCCASSLVFYSPSIGPFDWGTKVEGTFGKQSFGALAFRGFNQVTGDEFADEAFGYQHAMQDGSFAYWGDGVLAHHSISGDDATIDTGVEGRDLKHGWIWYFDHSFENGSWVPNGHADQTQAFIDMHKPSYEVNFGYFDASPNYNPIDGYTANSDIRGPMAYVFVPGTARGLKSWNVNIEGDRFLDDSGAVHQADSQVGLNAIFNDGISLDGLGPVVGLLRAYAIPSGPDCSGKIVGTSTFTGYPCYLDGVTTPYNLMSIPIGYRDGTPRPIDATYAFGSYGGNAVHLFTVVTSRPLGPYLTLGLEYDGTYERSLATGILQSQWLRRVTVGVNLSKDASLTLALRDIDGLGGFATQVGNNLAVAFNQHFRNGNQLFINFGSPAAGATLNRLIVKFVFHAGADEGT